MAEMITERLKLKDILPDKAKEISAEHGIDEDAVGFIRKGLVPADLEFDEGERAIVSYITTSGKDRDREIVLPKGGDLRDYRKNPVVMFGHDYSQLPIGKNLWIKADERGLIAKTKYANHEEAEKVYQYRKDGFPLAESIGFVPLSYIPSNEFSDKLLTKLGLSMDDVEGVRCIYDKWLLLEYSDVPVPSNPEALQIAVSKGLTINHRMAQILPKDTSQAQIKDDLDYAKSLIAKGNLNEENGNIAWDIVRERITGGDIPEDILLKVGAVLSSKNKSDLGKARELIQNVLDSSEPQQPTQEPEKEVEEVETTAPVVLSVTELAEMVRQEYQKARDYQLGKV